MYFWTPRLIKLTAGERFATCFTPDGVPAHYPTMLALNYRRKNSASSTIEQYMHHLVHFERCCIYNGNDIIRSMESGQYPSEADAEMLADAAGITTKALRRFSARKVVRFPKSWGTDERVSNQTKSGRLKIFADLIDLVGKCYESELKREERKPYQELRLEVVERLKEARPRIASLNRVFGGPTHQQLGRLTRFLMEFNPNDTAAVVWEKPELNERNWAIARTLIECGLRNSELRGLKVSDVDLNKGELRVLRRPDDKDDPRIHEPNAKTYERRIPISDDLCQFIENYIFGYGSEAAERSGSPFLFLSHAKNALGQPLSKKTIERVVQDIGAHLEIGCLRPHDFRHSWMQNLADLSIRNGIEPAEFTRMANNLGGWSYLSTMATEYRGDQLAKYAFEKGLKVQEDRFDG